MPTPSDLRAALLSNPMGGEDVLFAILEQRVNSLSPAFRDAERAWVDRIRASLATPLPETPLGPTEHVHVSRHDFTTTPCPLPEGAAPRTWPSRDDIEAMSDAEVNAFLASRGLDVRVAEGAAPSLDVERIANIRLLLIDAIATDLGREFADGSPFEPFDRIYVVKTITRILDDTRDRVQRISPTMPAAYLRESLPDKEPT